MKNAEQIMSEYEEITNGKTIPELEKELQHQLDLGFDINDSFPQHILDCISTIRFNEGKSETLIYKPEV